MIVKILDTNTNETFESSLGDTIEWWSTGNGSCDCNRVPNENIEKELNKEFCKRNNIEFIEDEDPGLCFGAERFLIIDIVDSGEEKIKSKVSVIKEMNKDYPKILKDKYCR